MLRTLARTSGVVTRHSNRTFLKLPSFRDPVGHIVSGEGGIGYPDQIGYRDSVGFVSDRGLITESSAMPLDDP